AKQANMDMLRLNAHVEPPGLYESADRSGVLLWQDLPLIGSYVHRADARSLAFFRDAVLSQAEELTHLGYNHPSVVTYAVHADPPWSHSLKWLGERHTEQLNRDVDEEASALLRSLDPSRPVLPGARHQDLLLRFAVDRFRRQKFAHCGGVLISQLVDGFPAISTALLDHVRRPKRAYRSVADAFAPLYLTVDLPENQAAVDGLLLRLPRG